MYSRGEQSDNDGETGELEQPVALPGCQCTPMGSRIILPHVRAPLAPAWRFTLREPFRLFSLT